MPPDFLQALLDPTAPLPAGWPTGTLGVFLLFLVPVGGGIPLGVIMARNAGIPPPVTIGFYLVSDIVLAITTEPLIAFFAWLGRHVDVVRRIGGVFSRLAGRAGLDHSGKRGPLGLILLSFSISPTTGRAAAAAAGHGFFPGWAMAITGDMGYFLLLMVSTLWLSGVLGDDRVTIGAVLLITWLVPMLIGRIRRARWPAAPPAPLATGPDHDREPGSGPRETHLSRRAAPAGAVGGRVRAKRRSAPRRMRR